MSCPTGFVGQALAPILAASGAPLAELPPGASQVAIGALGETGDIDLAALAGCHTLIHLAARAHRMGDDPRDLAPYARVNVDGSVALMRAAIAAGLRRVVYISSIKVLGEATFCFEGEPPQTPPGRLTARPSAGRHKGEDTKETHHLVQRWTKWTHKGHKGDTPPCSALDKVDTPPYRAAKGGQSRCVAVIEE